MLPSTPVPSAPAPLPVDLVPSVAHFALTSPSDATTVTLPAHASLALSSASCVINDDPDVSLVLADGTKITAKDLDAYRVLVTATISVDAAQMPGDVTVQRTALTTFGAAAAVPSGTKSEEKKTQTENKSEHNHDDQNQNAGEKIQVQQPALTFACALTELTTTRLSQKLRFPVRPKSTVQLSFQLLPARSAANAAGVDSSVPAYSAAMKTDAAAIAGDDDDDATVSGGEKKDFAGAPQSPFSAGRPQGVHFDEGHATALRLTPWSGPAATPGHVPADARPPTRRGQRSDTDQSSNPHSSASTRRRGGGDRKTKNEKSSNGDGDDDQNASPPSSLLTVVIMGTWKDETSVSAASPLQDMHTHHAAEEGEEGADSRGKDERQHFHQMHGRSDRTSRNGAKERKSCKENKRSAAGSGSDTVAPVVAPTEPRADGTRSSGTAGRRASAAAAASSTNAGARSSTEPPSRHGARTTSTPASSGTAAAAGQTTGLSGRARLIAAAAAARAHGDIDMDEDEDDEAEDDEEFEDDGEEFDDEDEGDEEFDGFGEEDEFEDPAGFAAFEDEDDVALQEALQLSMMDQGAAPATTNTATAVADGPSTDTNAAATTTATATAATTAPTTTTTEAPATTNVEAQEDAPNAGDEEVNGENEENEGNEENEEEEEDAEELAGMLDSAAPLQFQPLVRQRWFAVAPHILHCSILSRDAKFVLSDGLMKVPGSVAPSNGAQRQKDQKNSSRKNRNNNSGETGGANVRETNADDDGAASASESANDEDAPAAIETPAVIDLAAPTSAAIPATATATTTAAGAVGAKGHIGVVAASRSLLDANTVPASVTLDGVFSSDVAKARFPKWRSSLTIIGEREAQRRREQRERRKKSSASAAKSERKKRRVRDGVDDFIVSDDDVTDDEDFSDEEEDDDDEDDEHVDRDLARNAQRVRDAHRAARKQNRRRRDSSEDEDSDEEFDEEFEDEEFEEGEEDFDEDEEGIEHALYGTDDEMPFDDEDEEEDEDEDEDEDSPFQPVESKKKSKKSKKSTKSEMSREQSNKAGRGVPSDFAVAPEFRRQTRGTARRGDVGVGVSDGAVDDFGEDEVEYQDPFEYLTHPTSAFKKMGEMPHPLVRGTVHEAFAVSTDGRWVRWFDGTLTPAAQLVPYRRSFVRARPAQELYVRRFPARSADVTGTIENGDVRVAIGVVSDPATGDDYAVWEDGGFTRLFGTTGPFLVQVSDKVMDAARNLDFGASEKSTKSEKQNEADNENAMGQRASTVVVDERESEANALANASVVVLHPPRWFTPSQGSVRVRDAPALTSLIIDVVQGNEVRQAASLHRGARDGGVFVQWVSGGFSRFTTVGTLTSPSADQREKATADLFSSADTGKTATTGLSSSSDKEKSSDDAQVPALSMVVTADGAAHDPAAVFLQEIPIDVAAPAAAVPSVALGKRSRSADSHSSSNNDEDEDHAGNAGRGHGRRRDGARRDSNEPQQNSGAGTHTSHHSPVGGRSHQGGRSAPLSGAAGPPVSPVAMHAVSPAADEFGSGPAASPVVAGAPAFPQTPPAARQGVASERSRSRNVSVPPGGPGGPGGSRTPAAAAAASPRGLSSTGAVLPELHLRSRGQTPRSTPRPSPAPGAARPPEMAVEHVDLDHADDDNGGNTDADEDSSESSVIDIGRGNMNDEDDEDDEEDDDFFDDDDEEEEDMHGGESDFFGEDDEEEEEEEEEEYLDDEEEDDEDFDDFFDEDEEEDYYDEDEDEEEEEVYESVPRRGRSASTTRLNAKAGARHAISATQRTPASSKKKSVPPPTTQPVKASVAPSQDSNDAKGERRTSRAQEKARAHRERAEAAARAYVPHDDSIADPDLVEIHARAVAALQLVSTPASPVLAAAAAGETATTDGGRKATKAQRREKRARGEQDHDTAAADRRRNPRRAPETPQASSVPAAAAATVALKDLPVVDLGGSDDGGAFDGFSSEFGSDSDF